LKDVRKAWDGSGARIDNDGRVGYDSSSMAILIDSFMNGARGPYPFRHRRCGHLVSDTSIEELHTFAENLGMRREWFQCRSIPHYDLTGERYDLALAMGAEPVSSRDLVRRAVRWNKTGTVNDEASNPVRTLPSWVKKGFYSGIFTDTHTDTFTLLSKEEGSMDRRAFLKTILAGGSATLLSSNTYALKLFPNTSKQRWAILFGSRYGSTRDASLWISEGMGWVADVFDGRENPDLSSFDGIIIGSGIYMGKIDQPLEDYLAKNAAALSKKIKALFVVCGAGENPRAQGYVDVLAKSCQAKPALTKVFPGRLTLKLLNAEDYKVQEDVAKRRNAAPEDYDRLQRKDCLKFGGDIRAAG
jgi:menaquinone-dependent protoporphyrinogen IX oxidase